MPPAMSAAIAGEGMGEGVVRIFGWLLRALRFHRGARALFAVFRPARTAKEFIHRHMKDICKRDELRRLGEGLARLPFGDRAIGHAQLLRKFLLRHARAAAQTI